MALRPDALRSLSEQQLRNLAVLVAPVSGEAPLVPPAPPRKESSPTRIENASIYAMDLEQLRGHLTLLDQMEAADTDKFFAEYRAAHRKEVRALVNARIMQLEQPPVADTGIEQ